MRVISIITRGRSGALFFQSLLDGHPNISTIPGPFMSDFFNWYEKNKNLELKSLINNFINNHNSIKSKNLENFGFTKMGEKRDKILLINKKNFIKNFLSFFKKNNQLNRKTFFINLHLSYSLTIGHDIKNIDTILYYMHDYNFHNAQLIESDFPKTKFIYMVRETVQTIISIINNYYDSDMLNLKRSYVIRNPFLLIKRHFYPLTKKKENHVFLKLEDLHLNSIDTMRKVCVFLNIKWHDNLLKSTFSKKKWWNYSSSQKISGFNKSIVKEKKIEILSNFNLKVLNSLFYNVNKLFGYEDKSKKYNILLAIFLMIIVPFKFEILGFRSAEKKIKDIFFILYEYVLLRKVIVQTILMALSYKTQKKFPYLKKIKSHNVFINQLK